MWALGAGGHCVLQHARALLQPECAAGVSSGAAQGFGVSPLPSAVCQRGIGAGAVVLSRAGAAPPARQPPVAASLLVQHCRLYRAVFLASGAWHDAPSQVTWQLMCLGGAMRSRGPHAPAPLAALLMLCPAVLPAPPQNWRRAGRL